MPVYERGRGQRRHIWEITVEGNALVIRHGKVGQKPETYRREYHHASDAAGEVDRIIASRLADGYTLVRDEPPPVPPAPRSEIERQLRANPDDVELALVLADWLQQHGDPRGRLIVVQHELARQPRPELVAEERDLLTTHAAALLGELARYDRTVVRYAWKRGFLSDVRLAYDDAFPGDSVAEMLRIVCRRPDAPFIESLALGMPDGEPDHMFDYVVEQLVANARQLPRLSRLFIGDFMIGDEAEMSWTHLGDLAAVFPAFPRLTALTIQGGTFELGTIDAPALRELEIRTGGLAATAVRAITEAALPSLERLVLWFGSSAYGGGSVATDVVALVRAHERVRHLGICNAEFTDEACRLLAEMPIAARLVSLDLSRGTLTDDGAAALARGSYPQLATLDVRANYLTPRGIATLQAMCGETVELRADAQRDATDSERYPAVGE